MTPLDQRIRVVLVDDFAPLVERLAKLLTSAGLAVVGTFNDGASALEALPRLDPDVVVLDINMPRTSGIEVLKAIRGARLRCRVVMLTANPEPELQNHCLALGADAFLRKDSDFERVREWILGESSEIAH